MSIWAALADRFAAPEWAYFEQVRNGTGYSRSVTRTADALAFSLYPSRGLELHGIEVKVGRGDWLKEKKDPNKAEEIAKFCACWWLVTTELVVKDVGEVPPGWGWLELAGKKLITKRQAARREAVPLDLPMVAAILRRASENEDARLSARVLDCVTARMEDERQTYKELQDKLVSRVNEAEAEAQRYRSLLHQIENGLGERILELPHSGDSTTQLTAELKERLQLFKQADLQEARRQLEVAADQLRSAALNARWVLRQAGVRVLGRSVRRPGVRR